MKKQSKIFIVAVAVVILLTMITPESKAEALIKNFEGKKLRAYKDSGGIYTIGYGSIYHYDLQRPVRFTDVITEEQALKWLRIEIASKLKAVKKFIKVPVTQNQLDALTSLTYNIGSGAFFKSTLLKKLNAGKPIKEVADEFLKWNKVNGQTIPGLTNRRILERDLFLSN